MCFKQNRQKLCASASTRFRATSTELPLSVCRNVRTPHRLLFVFSHYVPFFSLLFHWIFIGSMRWLIRSADAEILNSTSSCRSDNIPDRHNSTTSDWTFRFLWAVSSPLFSMSYISCVRLFRGNTTCYISQSYVKQSIIDTPTHPWICLFQNGPFFPSVHGTLNRAAPVSPCPLRSKGRSKTKGVPHRGGTPCCLSRQTGADWVWAVSHAECNIYEFWTQRGKEFRPVQVQRVLGLYD